MMILEDYGLILYDTQRLKYMGAVDLNGNKTFSIYRAWQSIEIKNQFIINEQKAYTYVLSSIGTYEVFWNLNLDQPYVNLKYDLEHNRKIIPIKISSNFNDGKIISMISNKQAFAYLVEKYFNSVEYEVYLRVHSFEANNRLN